MNNKVLIITGGTSGIGKAVAKEALERDYFVVVASRNSDSLNKIADEFNSEKLVTQVTDISKLEDLTKLKEFAIEKFGRVDVVIANAGSSSGPTQYRGEQAEKWKEMIDTNILGSALTANAFLPELEKTKGCFILVGSVTGRIATEGRPYSMTKWAVTGMTESIRKEMRGTGVKVCCVQPGMVETSFWPDGTDFSTALKPEDVARSVFFVTEQPSHVDINEILVRPTGQGL